MAVWNPDNVLLTNKGREVLSKVQAGIGKITVTRIVTGGTAVPLAQLYNQTEIPNIKQTCTIMSTVTDYRGSDISVSLSNENLAEEYSLYTIGIYITHQDYDGEVLYLIAECNTDNPDRIPLPTETIVTLYYSLYMEHTNTDNVTIEVSQEGLITNERINQPNGVAGLDGMGLLQYDVIPVGNASNSGGVLLSDSVSSSSDVSGGTAATPKAVKQTYDYAATKSTKNMYTVTVTVSSWTGTSLTVSVPGILSTDTPVIGVVLTGADSTDKTLLEAWALVSRITTDDDAIVLYAYGNKPTVNLPLQIMCMR